MEVPLQAQVISWRGEGDSTQAFHHWAVQLGSGNSAKIYHITEVNERVVYSGPENRNAPAGSKVLFSAQSRRSEEQIHIEACFLGSVYGWPNYRQATENCQQFAIALWKYATGERPPTAIGNGGTSSKMLCI